MFADSSKTVWNRVFTFCVLLKGVFCNSWDPLPAGVRSVVSSNHLGEGTPQVFAEYHALLPNYRGDYGVKSELVEAATLEPVYKGAETLILPLYIPHGAVPLPVNDRRTRSGKPDGIANMRVLRGPSPSVREISDDSSVNRPSARRIVTSGRRQPSGSRVQATPPPSFIRPWMKRRNETPSAELKDNEEDAKWSAQNILNKLANIRRRSETITKLTHPLEPDQKSEIINETDFEVFNNSGRSKAVTRIKKITTRLDNKPIRRSNPLNSTTASTLKLNMTNSVAETIPPEDKNYFNKIFNETASSDRQMQQGFNYSQNSTILLPELIDTVSLTANEMNKISMTNSSTNKPLSENQPISAEDSHIDRTTEKPAAIAIITRRRAVVIPKPVDEILRVRTKPVMPFMSKFRQAEDELTSSTLPPSTTPTTFSTIIISSSTTNPTATTNAIPQTSSSPALGQDQSAENTKVKPKTSEWLSRRRASILQGVKSNRQTPKELLSKENFESIIDRVLNSATNPNEENVWSNQSHNNTDTDGTYNTTSSTALFVSDESLGHNDMFIKTSTQDNDIFSLPTLGNRESKIPTTTLPVAVAPTTNSFGPTSMRQRIPLRTHRPVVSNPMKSITITDETEVLHPNNQSQSNTKLYLEDLKNNRNVLYYSTNSITTSTPKLPSSITTPSSNQNNFNPVEPIAKEIKNVLPSKETNFRSTWPTGILPISTSLKMKSPQDIVLEKLSELMKNATEGKKENVEDIVIEIEKLNKELASMGIHIIDAEFNGKKIKLTDQLHYNRPGSESLRATTIRYVIPNSNSRSSSNGNGVSKISSQSNDKNGYRIPLKVLSNDKNRDASFSENLQMDSISKTYATDIPYFPENYTDKSEISQSPTIGAMTTVISETESPHDVNSNTRSYSAPTDQMRESPIVVRTVFDKERETISNISATSIVSSSESTRSRSTAIPINNTEQSITTALNPSMSISTPTGSYNKNDKEHAEANATTIPEVNIYNTAHLRPNSSFTANQPNGLNDSLRVIDVESPSIGNNDEEYSIFNSTETTNILINEIVKINETNPNRKSVLEDKLDNPLTYLVSELGEVEGNEIISEGVNGDNSYIYFVGILGIIPCVVAIAFVYKRRQESEKKALPEREEQAEGFTPPTNHTRPVTHNETLDAFPGYIFEASQPRESPWELSRSKLRLTSVIGEGNFGIVWKAEARNLCDWEENGGPTVLVAVKGVKEGAGDKEKKDLLRELSIMQHLGQHPNLVTLLGCCTTNEPYHLVMEYVMFGKLLTFLREQRSKNNYFNFSSDSDHLTSRDLTRFACQIATGCEYLQSRGVIHRDLAARNILVDHKKVCKIADFGLARSVKDLDSDIYEQKSKGPLPIRWMAPESLYMNIFTHKSDVWSFGILCWEIVTLGSTPYPGTSAREVMRRVREGYRLERPEHCRTEFYKIVTKCWHQDLNKRASFTTVKEEIKDLLENNSGWIDLENFQEATYYSMHENNEEKL